MVILNPQTRIEINATCNSPWSEVMVLGFFRHSYPHPGRRIDVIDSFGSFSTNRLALRMRPVISAQKLLLQ
jgi:hypothetical protein